MDLRSALLGGALLLVVLLGASCGEEPNPEPTPAPVCEGAPAITWSEAQQALPANRRDPVKIEQLRVAYACEDFPSNDLALGAFCATNADCAVAGSICVQGLLPCGAGVCTQRCLRDRDCHPVDIDFDSPPPLVCVIAQEHLSICMPSGCLPRIPGWDETCGPLSGEAVNELGIGKKCDSQDDCPVGSICPVNGADPTCSANCTSDEDCGPNAACTCVDNPDCTQQFLVCAPDVACAEAVRHHHCRGPGIPPRDHEFACGDHGH